MADLGSRFEHHRPESALKRMRGCGKPDGACADYCDRLLLFRAHRIHPSRMTE
jgi:hypothetical protein